MRRRNCLSTGGPSGANVRRLGETVGLRRYRIAFLLLGMSLLSYVDRATISFAATGIASSFHLTPIALGYLFSSFLWSYAALVVPMGLLVDRFGPKRVAGLGLAVWSVATVAGGLATGYGSLLLTRLVMGGAEAVSNPSGARVVRSWFPAAERGIVTALFNSGSYIGPALCALIAGPMIVAFGWRSLFFVSGVLGLMWLLIWLRVFEQPEGARWLGEGERRRILATRNAEQTGMVGPLPKASGLFRLLRTGTGLWGLALTQGCNVYAQYLFLTWLPSYLRHVLDVPVADVGLWIAVPYAVAAATCIVVGYASDRLLRGRVSGGSRRLAVAAMAGLVATVAAIPFAHTIGWAVLLAALSLSGIASTTSLNFALLNDLVASPSDVGACMGFVVLVGNLFGLTAPIVTGYVVSATGGYTAAFLAAGALQLLGASSALLLSHGAIAVMNAPTASAPRKVA